MTNDTYPPLPEPAAKNSYRKLDYFTADQMHAYLAADRAERGEVVAWVLISSAYYCIECKGGEVYLNGVICSAGPYAAAPPSHAGDEALLRQCEWKEHDPNGAMPDSWDSACGETWSFVDGGDPGAHNVRFCQGCGRKVLPVAYGDNHGSA